MKKQNHEKARLSALLGANKGTSTIPAKTQYTIFRQIVQWIPAGLPDKLAREAGADIRKFSGGSRVGPEWHEVKPLSSFSRRVDLNAEDGPFHALVCLKDGISLDVFFLRAVRICLAEVERYRRQYILASG